MKKILLIGLRYHTYTDDIIAELRGQGHRVSFHDIQPRDLLMKTLRIVAPAAYRRRIDSHHREILRSVRGQSFDQVLFIQAHQMALPTLRGLREALAGAEFILYNWDSISNHDYRPHLPLFDRAYTFDPEDAKALGIGYLPLFCVPAFQALARREQGRKAVYFVGNIVSLQRYEALQIFKRYCRQQDITFKAYLACTPYVLWLLLRSGRLPWDVSLGPVPHARFIDMIETSTTVFDFANHQQSGYTMRTMENLCAGKKIITANPRVRNEAFYSADRFHVFEGVDFSGVKAFVEHPLAEPDRRFPEFHLDSFVAKLTQAHIPSQAGAAVHP